MTAPGAEFDVVIPTVGRPSLAPLVRHVGRTVSPASRIVVADDRPDTRTPLLDGIDCLDDDPRITVVQSGGQGPAAARNRGWRATSRSWVAFLDDDVELTPGWVRDLDDDLRAAPPTVGAVTGRIEVPHPPRRRPSDWERNVACLERAQAVTADMAIRRAALEAVGGVVERLPRADLEDTDLAPRPEEH